MAGRAPPVDGGLVLAGRGASQRPWAGIIIDVDSSCIDVFTRQLKGQTVMRRTLGLAKPFN